MKDMCDGTITEEEITLDDQYSVFDIYFDQLVASDSRGYRN